VEHIKGRLTPHGTEDTEEYGDVRGVEYIKGCLTPRGTEETEE